MTKLFDLDLRQAVAEIGAPVLPAVTITPILETAGGNEAVTMKQIGAVVCAVRHAGVALDIAAVDRAVINQIVRRYEATRRHCGFKLVVDGYIEFVAHRTYSTDKTGGIR